MATPPTPPPSQLVKDMQADKCKALCFVHSAAWYMFQLLSDIAHRNGITRRQLKEITKLVKNLEEKLDEVRVR